MRLSAYSDYTLRVLIFLGVHGDRLATIADIAAAYGISENHLMKVVHHLGQRGYVETVRGRGGGLRLARPPEAISIGEVIRGTEENARLVECFDRDASECRIDATCVLRGLLGRAQEAFFAVLDRHSLADLIAPRTTLARLLPFSRARTA